MSKIALIDVSNMIYRAFFAVKYLSTNDGIATNAVYGALKSFKSIIKEIKPSFVIACWDNGKKTFRHEQDTTYKAHRPATPDDLKTQFNALKEAFNILKIPQMVAPVGLECDDLIGTLSTMASNGGIEAVIVSSDKDFYQLCNENIKVFSPHRKTKTGNGYVTEQNILNEFDVNPRQLVDVKALTGEKSDNIQGIKGIGPKTAINLIKQYETVHNLLENLSINPGKYANIINAADVVRNAYDLALIKVDAPIEEIPVKPVDKLKVNKEIFLNWCEHYEMKEMASKSHEWIHMFDYVVNI